MSTVRRLPLYWRVVLTNGLVFLAGTLALALSPATVSSRVLESEAVVLALGLTVIVATNALLLRRSLAPLDRLATTMAGVHSSSEGARIPQEGEGVVGELIEAYNEMLDRLETERSIGDAKALAAQEAERQRIAQELHDEIGQSLTVVLLALKQSRDRAPDELTDELTEVQESVRESLDDVRRIARRLRPGVLDDLGLVSALAQLATDISKHGGIHVRRGFAPGLPVLDHEVELVIYRVAQEALTNVSRHSGASTVDLTLTRQGGSVLLRVCDDGRGMQGAPASTGIRGMRERAHLVGGTLEVAASDSGGTEVRLRVPARTTGTGNPP